MGLGEEDHSGKCCCHDIIIEGTYRQHDPSLAVGLDHLAEVVVVSFSTVKLLLSQPTTSSPHWRSGELRCPSGVEHLHKLFSSAYRFVSPPLIDSVNQYSRQYVFMEIYLGYNSIVLYFGALVLPALVTRSFFSWLLCPFGISPLLSVFGVHPHFLALLFCEFF